MDEITLDDKTYVSSKRAAQITGYAKDYVGQLCREGRVEARLVGRNWYVLEDSIREHRFGIEGTAAAPSGAVAKQEMASEPAENTPNTVSQVENASESTWQSPSYTSDPTPNLIPTLNSAKKLDEINVLDKYPARDEFGNVISDVAESNVVKEMQSAWHDWFVRTNELSVSKETLLEDPKFPQKTLQNIDEMTSEDLARQGFHDFNNLVQSSSASIPVVLEPVSLEKVTEVIEKGAKDSADSFGAEEVIPIHRTSSDSLPIAQKETKQRPAPPFYSRGELRSDIFTRKDEQEGRIIRERRVLPKKKPSLILQVFFLCIAGLAIVVAVIGSGTFESFISARAGSYAPIQYLVGESNVVK